MRWIWYDIDKKRRRFQEDRHKGCLEKSILFDTKYAEKGVIPMATEGQQFVCKAAVRRDDAWLRMGRKTASTETNDSEYSVEGIGIAPKNIESAVI